MGYTDLSLVGADESAAMLMDIAERIAKPLKRMLREPGNEFNPSGAVNVGMFFEEVIAKNPDPWCDFESDLYDIAVRAKEDIEQNDIEEAKMKDEWGNEANRLEHLRKYRAIVKGLNRFIAKYEETHDLDIVAA